MSTHAIKSFGYLLSCVSVILLGIVSWRSASEDGMLMAALLTGMIGSIIGIFLRWLSYEREKRQG